MTVTMNVRQGKAAPAEDSTTKGSNKDTPAQRLTGAMKEANLGFGEIQLPDDMPVGRRSERPGVDDQTLLQTHLSYELRAFVETLGDEEKALFYRRAADALRMEEILNGVASGSVTSLNDEDRLTIAQVLADSVSIGEAPLPEVSNGDYSTALAKYMEDNDLALSKQLPEAVRSLGQSPVYGYGSGEAGEDALAKAVLERLAVAQNGEVETAADRTDSPADRQERLEAAADRFRHRALEFIAALHERFGGYRGPRC